MRSQQVTILVLVQAMAVRDAPDVGAEFWQLGYQILSKRLQILALFRLYRHGFLEANIQLSTIFLRSTKSFECSKLGKYCMISANLPETCRWLLTFHQNRQFFAEFLINFEIRAVQRCANLVEL